jgi:predicted ribosome-associated RNA-binding protein Tma20
MAVVYAFNGMVDQEGEQTPQYCPVAIGRMLSKGDLAEALPKKGKAVQVDHYLFDELWNMGSRKIPQEF